MKVMKFGGTSVGKPERMHQVAKLVTMDDEAKIVVLSALSGTTNTLVAIGNELSIGEKEKAKKLIDDLEAHYHNFIIHLLKKEDLREKANAIVKAHFEFLNIILKISFSDALSKDILAQGELMSTKLFSVYLEEIGVDHLLLPALEFMRIDANDEPDLKAIKAGITPVLKKHQDKKVFVTQGYISRNVRGEVDNLKRGGSDYTASLIASAIGASVCEIWTDIDGMHNNDPRIVEKTVAIETLSFEEAAELAYFGAKILHPTCIWPAQKAHVPVKLLNTMAPEAKGTTIQDIVEAPGPKAVAAKSGIVAIKIKSSRMLLAYGFLRKVFEVFEKYRTPIDMITTSEVTVSLTIEHSQNLSRIVKELEPFGSVEIEKNLTIVSIVGSHVAEQKDGLMKIFDTIHQIPLQMISYGSSSHNISFLISDEHRDEMLKAINQGVFGL